MRTAIGKRLLSQSRKAAGIVVAVGVVWLVFFVLTDGVFLTDRNLINLMRQTSITAMVAMGMLVVIAQGEIDLSVGSFLGLCATVIALMEFSGRFPATATIVVALLLGVLIGLWNGLWVAKLGVPAFVTTLGGMLAFRGLSLALSGGRTVSGIHDEIRFLGEAFIMGPALWVVLLVAVGAALLPLRRMTDPRATEMCPDRDGARPLCRSVACVDDAALLPRLADAGGLDAGRRCRVGLGLAPHGMG